MKLSKICFSVIGICLLLTGCSKKEVTKHQNRKLALEMQQKSGDHRWFYFANDSFSEIDLPQRSPISSLKPWTESVRICDGNVTADGKAILLVNHLGALCFDETDNPVLIQDYQLFSDSTAGNLVFEGGVPYFTLVKNSFFNKTANQNSNQSHIIRLSTTQKMFFPVVTYNDLKIEQSGEVTGTYFDGNDWVSSIKSTKNNKVSFHYIKWKSLVDLAAVQPFSSNQTSGSISVSEITESSYRHLVTPEDFSKAPLRLKNLLKSIPKDFSFMLTCRDFGGSSPRYFSSGSDDGTVANAIIKDNWVCAVFGDGTTYFSGSLDGHPLINGGKTVAFRLPKLPKRYSYQAFVLTGNYLIVAWEENDFYKTGRSGFLTVDMEKLFYKS
ncbi:MAG: hypothetical protein IJ207_13955 [Treponema sp.]|uniref:hypothetical protein n=1 Tax=Treponema sp. TaxID=166 RepID=UPI0025DF1512|nr:hypothetical protein [Treponema sp.]MBQ9283278.1 hypothetical protein [Treponema sp.]